MPPCPTRTQIVELHRSLLVLFWVAARQTFRFPVGADVERLRPVDAKALGARILSPSERLEFDTAEPDARDAGMFRV